MLTYGLDIINNFLWRVRQLQLLKEGQTEFYDVARDHVNRAYYEILTDKPWPWALKDPPGVLNVVAKVTGTATIAHDSTSITLGATISSSMAGRWFEIDSEEVPYRISAHTAGTASLTLDATYKEVAVSYGAFTIYKDEYTLASDCLRVWGAKNRNDPNGIVDVVDANYMHEELPDRSTYSVNSGGKNNTQITMTIVQGEKARISPWPDTDDITIEYSYCVKPTSDLSFDKTTNDTPLVPLESRYVISDKAMFNLLSDLGDEKMLTFDGIVKRGIQKMVDNYLTSGKPKAYVKSGTGIWSSGAAKVQRWR
jgi:hypothetical protein